MLPANQCLDSTNPLILDGKFRLVIQNELLFFYGFIQVIDQLSLAFRLGLVVTAEGVESPLQMEILSRLGCQQLQGYLLGIPMDVKRLEEFEYTSSTYFN